MVDSIICDVITIKCDIGTFQFLNVINLNKKN